MSQNVKRALTSNVGSKWRVQGSQDPNTGEINRIYANGQTANQNGTAHIDNHLPNTFTLLYYPNLEWHWLWNGALFFLNATGSSPNPQTDIVRTVSFKPNRAVYFSANMCHYAEAPSNIFKDLRVSIAWKLSKYLY